MVFQENPTPEMITLDEASEAAGVPAAAISRLVALQLLEPEGQCGGVDVFPRSALHSIRVLRIMELLGYSPQDMRTHAIDGQDDGNGQDLVDILTIRAGQLSSHNPEINYLLSQLNKRTD
ncbi:hypothetical protein [Glutamicibacter nicotianae]|uniref:hypothetical protein n=1 Tax=Glutamicibacter nicotianae TaxID=37929 RepID=UPI000EF904DD|nr:hypothetical protein [Glutamicibacter nicotianae]